MQLSLRGKNKARTVLGIRLSALIEIVIFFVLMILLEWLLRAEKNFFYVSPHPYWAIVILISAQYGTKEGLLAAIAAIVAYSLGWLPEQSLLQDKYAYFFILAKNPILWLIAAVLLGELRMRQIRERESLKKESAKAKEEQKQISEAYSSLKKHKERLEMRFATEMRTALMAYQAFQELEQSEKSELFKGAVHLIDVVIAPEKFSIYLLNDNELQRVACQGWTKEDEYSLNYGTDHPLFQEIVGRRRLVTITDEKDRELFQNQGIAAVPVLASPSQKVYGMIKIETLPFLRLRLSALAALRLIGEWVGAAYENVLAKEDAESNRFISKKSALFTENYFSFQKNFMSQLSKRLKIDITLLTISCVTIRGYSEEKKLAFLNTFRKIVHTHLRSIDQPFEFTSEAEVALLLVNTSVMQADKVRQKIAEALGQEFGNELDFTYKTLPL